MWSIWYPTDSKGKKSNFIKAYENLVFANIKSDDEPKYYKK